MKIRLFVTGGTFDKIYNEIDGNLTFKETHLNEILEIIRNDVPVEIETLMLIDSLDMNDNHRKQILEKCKSCKEDKIIITHGTDTMAETARFLDNEIKNKTIVLTGAMVPYSFGKSDALFNLGSAIISAQFMPNGIYIVMNGRLFDCNNVRKNVRIGRFEKIK